MCLCIYNIYTYYVLCIHDNAKLLFILHERFVLYFYDRTDLFFFFDCSSNAYVKSGDEFSIRSFIVDKTRLSNTIKSMSDVCFIMTSVRHAMYSYREWPIITWPYRFMTSVYLNMYILIVFILINVFSFLSYYFYTFDLSYRDYIIHVNSSKYKYKRNCINKTKRKCKLYIYIYIYNFIGI